MFFFSSRRRHTRLTCDWSSDVCSSDLDLAQPPDVPEAFGPIVKGMQRAADDVRGLVAAVQANDQAAIQKYVAALEADGKALESIDQNSIDAAQKALFQPLIDSY